MKGQKSEEIHPENAKIIKLLEKEYALLIGRNRKLTQQNIADLCGIKKNTICENLRREATFIKNLSNAPHIIRNANARSGFANQESAKKLLPLIEKIVEDAAIKITVEQLQKQGFGAATIDEIKKSMAISRESAFYKLKSIHINKPMQTVSCRQKLTLSKESFNKIINNIDLCTKTAEGKFELNNAKGSVYLLEKMFHILRN